MRAQRMLILATAVLAGSSAFAAQFSLSGTARLSQDAPAQTNSRYSLRAQLTAAATSGAAAQSGARYTLFATLTTTSLACHNDTIFRDDFDGDGF
ncbi:MAG: hypothetical protein DYH18_01910 [Xanthomonadales bacterium PRO7]|jgi:hypothetical protein|nr:hypothetical protein [Xanthomonadales bacterium PRO7]HMM56255.1 hypothetical protein [Rudaea sp.]